VWLRPETVFGDGAPYEFDQDGVAGDLACTAVLGDHAAPLAESLAATVTSCDPRRTGPARRRQGRVTPRGGTGAGSPGQRFNTG
jgi:hypothetical protein